MNDILFEIYGFKIRPKTLYQVTEKLDSAAPDGFKEFKTTKALHPDISNEEPGAIFDGNLGIWDTGLYINSRALTEAVPVETERTQVIKDVQKYIVKPLEVLKGKDFLSQFEENNKFWDRYRISVKKDKIFNTEKPDELLQLYLAIIHKQITPKNLESHPAFKNSQYCIIDKEDSIDRKLESKMDKMKATGTFFKLLENKKDDLMLVLDYLKMGVSPKTDNKILVGMFDNWLEDKTDGYQNSRVFNKTYDFFTTTEGEKEIYYFSKLKDLLKKGIIRQSKDGITFEDEFIGTDLKSSAKTILSSKDLEPRFLKHIE
jgi:hypothetical protein